MVLLCSILVMISMLILLDYIEDPKAIRSAYQNKSNLHWLFVTGSLLGQGKFYLTNKAQFSGAKLSYLNNLNE